MQSTDAVLAQDIELNPEAIPFDDSEEDEPADEDLDVASPPHEQAPQTNSDGMYSATSPEHNGPQAPAAEWDGSGAYSPSSPAYSPTNYVNSPLHNSSEPGARQETVDEHGLNAADRVTAFGEDD